MDTHEKKFSLHYFLNTLRRKRLKHLKSRLGWKKKEFELKSELQTSSHSLFWVWEFSKKAVLICFSFYILVQVYAMVVMVKYYDFTHLGELINQTGEIVQNCVFGYLIKAGFENVGKIFCSNDSDDDSDEAVG